MRPPWQPVRALSAEAFRQIRRHAIFQCFKWDLQVQDVATLSPTPIVLRQEAWIEISQAAECLAAEVLAAERELSRRPNLHRQLGLPGAILKPLARAADTESEAAALRVVRFDFHYTTLGWNISEANTDVPGGFNEASGLARLFGPHYPGLLPAGDPAAALARAIQARTRTAGPVALAHATAFTDDRQVMLYLAHELKQLGCRTELLSPAHLVWREGQADIRASWQQGPAGFVFLFFPAEWLLNLPRACGWPRFFHSARTPLANPGSVLLTQTKRFPLVWEQLQTRLPTWRQLMPLTRDLREIDWRRDLDWVIKPALGRVGDRIGLHGVTDVRKWTEIYKSVQREPQCWVAQRRFEAVPMETEHGPVYPNIGVYTIDGRVAGAYGRLAPVPLIDQFAQDTAVLVAPAAPSPPFL